MRRHTAVSLVAKNLGSVIPPAQPGIVTTRKGYQKKQATFWLREGRQCSQAD